MSVRRIASLALVLVAGTACGDATARLVNHGNAAYERHEYQVALEDYVSAAVYAPDLPEPYYDAGNANYRLEDYTAAGLQLERALRSAEGELAQRSYYNLGNVLFNAKQFDQAVEAYKEALRHDPNDVDAKHNLELALVWLQRQAGDQGNPDQGQGGPQETPEAQAQEAGDQEGDQGDQRGAAESEGQPDSGFAPMSAEQAQKLLEAITQDTRTLRERLQRTPSVPEEQPEVDW